MLKKEINKTSYFERYDKKELSEVLYPFMKELKSRDRGFYVEWISFLTDGEKIKVDGLIFDYINCPSWGSIIMKYRKLLMESGDRGVVEDEMIIKAYENNDKKLLRSLLSEKTLEPIDESDIDFLLCSLNKRKKDIGSILSKLKRSPHIRLLRTIL